MRLLTVKLTSDSFCKSTCLIKTVDDRLKVSGSVWCCVFPKFQIRKRNNFLDSFLKEVHRFSKITVFFIHISFKEPKMPILSENYFFTIYLFSLTKITVFFIHISFKEPKMPILSENHFFTIYLFSLTMNHVLLSSSH